MVLALVRGHGPARDTAAALAVSSSSVYYIQNALNSCEGSLGRREEEVKQDRGRTDYKMAIIEMRIRRARDAKAAVQTYHVPTTQSRALWPVMVSVDVQFSLLFLNKRVKNEDFF